MDVIRVRVPPAAGLPGNDCVARDRGRQRAARNPGARLRRASRLRRQHTRARPTTACWRITYGRSSSTRTTARSHGIRRARWARSPCRYPPPRCIPRGWWWRSTPIAAASECWNPLGPRARRWPPTRPGRGARSDCCAPHRARDQQPRRRPRARSRPGNGAANDYHIDVYNEHDGPIATHSPGTNVPHPPSTTGAASTPPTTAPSPNKEPPPPHRRAPGRPRTPSLSRFNPTQHK
jgi:hypothetical protein